ncbi:MAG: hypothetical protein EBS73_15050 [Betaproteobacteria bacterium]|nr:hypothetical protein [Betaproteobacteria bacterium]
MLKRHRPTRSSPGGQRPTDRLQRTTHPFGRSREGFNADQLSLLDETIDTDIAAIEQELEALGQGTGQRQTIPRYQVLTLVLSR